MGSIFVGFLCRFSAMAFCNFGCGRMSGATVEIETGYAKFCAGPFPRFVKHVHTETFTSMQTGMMSKKFNRSNSWIAFLQFLDDLNMIRNQPDGLTLVFSFCRTPNKNNAGIVIGFL